MNEEDNPIWKTMNARRTPASEPMDETDAKLIRAFKKNHHIYAREVSHEMIQSKHFCTKCLLHAKLCQTIGNYVRDLEMEESLNGESQYTLRRYTK